MVLRISFLVATLVTFRGLSPSMVKLSSFLKFLKEALRKIRTPHIYFFSEKIRFALYRFRSPLITVSLLISLPPGTKMFQFPGFPLLSECKQEVPFGDPWINGSMHLPKAYRSLARPSSVLKPKPSPK